LSRLVVVERPERWPIDLPGTEVVAAKDYLTDRKFAGLRRATVFNLCRYYGYQRIGYYVSLLAAARGHRALPSVETLQAFGVGPLARITTGELEDLIQRSLAPLRSRTFELSIYFGRNVAIRYDALARALFDLFPAPFMRAFFEQEDGEWRMRAIRPLAGQEVPEAHRPFVIGRAMEYFALGERGVRRKPARYDLAVLWDETSADVASDGPAIRRFIRAAGRVGIAATVLEADDYSHVGEFDALFIRDNTNVDHYTYRFAQRAAAEGLVVIDDPRSIVRCSNKVYQAELCARHGMSHPRTLVVHADNVDDVEAVVGLPCVLKRPDSSFSKGVIKVAERSALHHHLAEWFRDSQLVVAQEFLPSDFDWRIGVLNGEALYACRYFMARGHWQIVEHREGKPRRYGRVETLPIEEAPAAARRLAVRAARLIGDGFYGVDIKELNGRCYLIEVNDNPTVENAVEDRVLKDGLYLAVMRLFRERLDGRGD
jgi:glutathione synthase/RimK-type ligase-like ATP-grasp enzyme